MSATPYIKPLSTRKGIFYSFQSATEDITLTFNNDNDKRFRFSKFALLRIPRIGEPDNDTDNKIQFEALGESPLIDGLHGNHNLNLSESFQNYCLNLESMVTAQDDYDRDTKLNTSERIFWKWLKELGAIRFRESNSTEKNSNTNEKLFVEEDEAGSTYNRIVQYIGEIDVINSVQGDENAYSQVYIHVPTHVGSTPYILFNSHEDKNYKPGMVLTHDPENPLNTEYLYGRDYNDSHPFGLSNEAFFDLDTGGVTTKIGPDSNNLSTGYWFNYNVTNTYYTDPNFKDATNDYIEKTYNNTTIEYYRSRLDGIKVDFNLTDYQLIQQNPDVETLTDFNGEVNNNDFEFNAVLVYYDTYNENNPQDFETNLYGILFLDQIQQADLEFEIPYLTKYEYDEVNQINGNSYVWSINYKLDTSVDNVEVERSINDYSTFSLELFTDVFNQMKDLNNRYENRLTELIKLQQQVSDLKTNLVNYTSNNEVLNRLTDVENSLFENQAIFSNTSSLMSEIDNLNDKIESIIRGDSPLELTYNLNALIQGNGMEFNRSGNRLVINSSNQTYNITNQIIHDFSSPNTTLNLKNFGNYFRHETNSVKQLNQDSQIIIDDSNVSWQNGQTVKIVFDTKLLPKVYNLNIYTDSENNFNKKITSLSKVDFNNSDNRPIIEIVCIDENNLEFRIDKIR